jgi:hypothetical protein
MKGNVQPGTHNVMQMQRPSLLRFYTQTQAVRDTNSAHFGVIGT